ncbi:MAG TPA: FG-GAP-like repeat-containing protein [Candidatus Dormibacteraeota bacterium]|nr:FG-GAP-like repeat-containing protein [Candidatus Dormibacteraeota bacterium]
MRIFHRRLELVALCCVVFVCGAELLLQVRAGQAKTSEDSSKSKSSQGDSSKALRLNTLGVAYMNQQRPADAQKLFEQALQADPKFAVARLNLGIALLNQQKVEAARAALEEAARQLPRDPYAWYNLGIAYKDLGEFEKGIAAFQRVIEISPNEADAYYFVGYLYSQLQKYDEAIAAFQKGLALNPFHASSEFGLARAYQRKGDSAAAREHLARFQKITTEHLGTPFGAGYGDQGRYSLAELVHAALEVPAAIPVRFTAQPMGSLLKSTATQVIGASSGACFIDYDGDGKPDLFLVSGKADGTSRLLHNLGNGRFEDVTSDAGLNLAGSGWGCAAGDFDNDGHPDLAVCLSDGVRLLRNNGNGRFEDVTQAVGIRREKGCVGLTFVDYDHDGDLDLYVTVAPDTGGPGAPAQNFLWRNNGNSTFTDISAETALGIAATGAGLVTTDFNNDRAIDFVFAGGSNGAAIYLNPREGKFSPLSGIDFKKENLPPAVGVIAFDFNKDGWMDLAFTHEAAPGISLWRNREGKALERVALPDFGWQHGWGLAAVDYDNDGWLDLVAVGESNGGGGQIKLLRNMATKGWSDVTKDVQLDTVKLAQPRALAIADTIGDGKADLIVTQLGGGPLLLRNEGGNKNKWLRIELQALNDNKSAIGTKVEIYAGPLYQKWEVVGASGYLGQNTTTVLAGLGSERNAEVVRLLWPTGVPQDEINVAAGKAHTISELDRRGSSCPVLFSWNGDEYEFIADMIGPGVVGHWIAPGERDVPDPDEYLKVPARSLHPRNGLLSFRFLEPMEETVYLDQVRLLAIDHPAAYEVYPNERFASTPPFPEFRVIASRNARPPAGAWDDHGKNVLGLIEKRDRKYVTNFEDLPFVGFAKLHWLELDLGEWDANKPLRLILDGYTDYFTATSMYAADQAGIKVIAPYVEALDTHGKWTRVVEDMGFPAGLARTMVADLTGKLPPGTRWIRIVNNLKIYWDAVRIDQTQETKDIHVAEVPLARAALEFLGFPREHRLQPASDTTYSYASRSMTGPYARAAGNYTRYGDVHDLLRASDERFVVFSSGEGVKLDFDPRRVPALPAGWVRDYFFYADGFEKDLDFYAADAFSVEPLPRHGPLAYPYPKGKDYPTDAEHQRYQLEYNTRQRSDRLPPSLRYDYTFSKGPKLPNKALNTPSN